MGICCGLEHDKTGDEEMKNMQLTLADKSIDSFIEELKKLKQDNNRIIRMGGEKGGSELIIIHANFRAPSKEKAKLGDKEE